MAGVKDEVDLASYEDQLKETLVKSVARLPRRHVKILDCLEEYRTLTELMIKTGMEEKSFWNAVDQKNGRIHDPVASVVYTNSRSIPIYENRISGDYKLKLKNNLLKHKINSTKAKNESRTKKP